MYFPINPSLQSLQTGNLIKWYASGHKGQLYTPGSVDFIKAVRSWVNEIREKSDRERLLLVSPGNTGLHHGQNQTLQYLGDDKAEGAHSVVLFDLDKFVGAKVRRIFISTNYMYIVLHAHIFVQI